ncbi:GNAT family N-acetyltransferase [Niveibacterium sp.]|uniref:GNAT family N-acetyltransferase n=1 Tax=Niveibacterium sp. TaxID=2017444 RepID=UPI0035B305A5
MGTLVTPPILLDIPDQFETERLLVRAPRPGDGSAVYDAVLESLAELRAWPASLPWALREPSADESEAYCRRGHADFLLRTDMPMLIFLWDDDTLVGATGLHRLDWQVPSCEIGYWGRSGYANRGLITEAIRGIARFARAQLGTRRIEARPDAENLPSRAVVERAGFALEGILRNERKQPDGRLRDTCIYALTT